MGLIKLALIGGAAYYVTKGLRGDREMGCGRRRKNETADMARGMTEEKQPNPYNTTGNPPSYPVEQYPFPSSAPYYNEKQLGPATSPPQQMVFVEPTHPYNATTTGPYGNNQQSYGGSVRSLPFAGTQHDDAVEQAMRHLDSGDQEKARQVLASAVNRKY